MLKISIAKLEQARVSPKAFATSLSIASGGFGNKGSFSGTFKSFIGKFHNQPADEALFLQKLQDAYKLQFVENAVNNNRSNTYCEAFSLYTKYMSDHSFGLDNFFTRIDLKMLTDVSLGGNSPILCSSNTRNMVFSIEEFNPDWKNELKYPILQKYLAEKYYLCEIKEVEIGIFNINTGKFELKIFQNFEIESAIDEAKTVLGNVKAILDKL